MGKRKTTGPDSATDAEVDSRDFDVVGEEFRTRSLQFQASEDAASKVTSKGTRRIRWKQDKAWRLRRVRVGNDPWALPGQEGFFDRATIDEARKAGRVVIVVGGQHSGLSSFRNWLVNGNVRAKVVDLADAQLAATTADGRLRGIASRLRRELGATSEDEQDPIEILRSVAEERPSEASPAPVTLIFSGFADLDDETAGRFFGRIRGLYEVAPEVTRQFGFVLLGSSIRALDPLQARPVSTLLSVAEVWTPLRLRELEVAELARGLIKETELDSLYEWTGGECLLVQAVLKWLDEEENKGRTVQDAIDLLERDRLPAFDTWKRLLGEKLNQDQEVSNLVHRLLRYASVPNEARIPRMPLLELLTGGWIRAVDSDEAAGLTWQVASDARRALMSETYSER